MKQKSLFRMTVKNTYALTLDIVADSQDHAQKMYEAMDIAKMEELDYVSGTIIATSIEFDAGSKTVMVSEPMVLSSNIPHGTPSPNMPMPDTKPTLTEDGVYETPEVTLMGRDANDMFNRLDTGGDLCVNRQWNCVKGLFKISEDIIQAFDNTRGTFKRAKFNTLLGAATWLNNQEKFTE
jgi:hypothetical protein